MNKVVVVTGASGRLGRLMVGGFSRQGYTVAPIGRGLRFDADLTSESDTARVFAAIGKQYASVYALIHTVGMWAAQPISQTTLSDWRRMVDVNLTSTFLCFKHVIYHMTQGEGRIIGVTSAQGADRGVVDQAAYSASKAGIIRLVEATAQEYAMQGVTAHALAPSMILYNGQEGNGVHAADLVSAAVFLCGAGGRAANGATWRMYGKTS